MPRLLAALLLALCALPRLLLAQGTGLTGQYYDTASFGTLVTTRTDTTVDFNWGTALPAGTALTNADTFSVAWNGQIEPEFSETYTFHVTADDGARLWINDRLIAARSNYASPSEIRGQVALTAGQKVNLRLEYIEQTGSASVRLEWSSASRAREVIPAARLYPARVDKAGGALLREHWSGLTGGTISSLTSSANYPAKPSGREFITSFEGLAQDWADSYGTRVTGYIVPPVTGGYTFAVSGDEVVELYLSTDSVSSNKTLVASVSAATGYRVFDTQPSQQSATRNLVQGQRYYVELLHKENTGADHWSVAWKKPGETVFSIIPGSALLQPGLTTAQPAETALLNTLAQEHPRLFSTPERFARLRAIWQSTTASQPKTWAQNAINSANGILTATPVTYAPDVRGTILAESQTVKDRMYKLGLAWQLTGDAQYAERAWTELSTVADNTLFPDWHPAHFLDTAEMTHACAIGYDWFYSYWTQARRDTIRTALINKGLNIGLSQYTSNAWWAQPSANNWNMVCNGGLSIGALAVGSESEALVENILNRALNSTRPVWKHFTTDNGAWYEGPGYWGYTTEYGIRMFAALESSLGSDFGISSTQNLSEAGLAPIAALGPSNIIFNYADASAGGPSRGPVFQWFARRYNQPVCNWWENQGSGGALDALWYADSTVSLATSGVSPDVAFHGEAGTAYQPQEMVTLRGSWNDSRATFVGVKGGEMGAPHGNLDAGTFVLDALGKRWFHDLGSDNYALSNYFNDTPNANGIDRWDYYRMRPEGQNTLTINPSANADMVLNAVAPLVAFQSETGGTGSFAIHDLTPVYSGMTKVWRGVRLLGSRNQVLVQDEIQAASGKTVWWFAHFTSPTTTVTIDPDGTSALMTQGAERLWCKILSGGGTFQIMDAVPLPTSPAPAGQNANTGHKKLAVNLAGVTNTTLAVWFVPLSSGEAIPTVFPAVTALSTWNLAAANDAPVAANGNASGSGTYVDVDLRPYVTDDSTPADLMRFTVANAVNGSVTLLADGHTARFTPTPGYTGVPSFSYTATDTAADPRALLAYDFDAPDASATNLVPDVSGLGRDGTLEAIGTGAATLSTDVPPALGRDGRSLNLTENGGANAARLTRMVASSELNWNTSDWTIAGWFKRLDTTNEDMIWHLNTGDGYGNAEELYLMASGANSFILHHYPGPDVSITVNTVPPGTWRHFAVVRSGTTLNVYLDGVLVGSDNSFALAINQATSPLIFGGHTDTSATLAPRWFDGKLDELAVFGAALSPAEITTLANGMKVRHFGGLSATGTITLSATPVTTVWNNATTGATLPWSTGTNWSGGVSPVSGRGAALQFFTGQTLTGGTVTSNHDLGAFTLNSLTLAGTSSAASTVSVSGGSLLFFNNGALNPAVTLSATAGSGLTYDIASPLTLGAATTFSGTGTASFRFSGVVDGPGDLIKSSSGSLILTGANTYTGDTFINSGTLQIGNDGASGSLGSGDVVNNGQLRFDRTGTLVVPNTIGGTGSLYVDCPINAGTVVLSGTNSFDGNVTVNSGALRITNGTALGDGTKTVYLSNGTSGAPSLRLDASADLIELPATISFVTSSSAGAIVNEAGDSTLFGDITLTSGGGSTKIVSNAGTLTLAGNLAPNTTGRTLDLGGTGTGVVTGSIADGSATNTLVLAKNDAGSWTLSGPVTITGTTSVNAGLLNVNGTLASGTVTVAASARLGGTGVITPNTTVSGTLQPGVGAGAIAFGGNLSFGSASKYSWELTANDSASGFDSASVTGILTVTSGAAVNLVLNAPGSASDFADAFWQSPRSWPVLTCASRTGSFALGTVSADSTGKAATAYGAFSLSHTGTGVNVLWTPALPAFAVTATTPTATEAGTVPGVFTVSRTNASTVAATVSLTVSGTATSGSDYDALPASILIPAGQSSVTVSVTPVDDSAVEPDETVIVTLATGTGYTVGASSSATVTLVSDDASYLWNQASAGTFNWSDTANWSGAVLPVNTAATSLDFVTGTTLAAVTVNSVHNLANPFTANTLTLGGAGPATGLATVSLSGNTISLVANAGLNPVVNLNATGTTLAYAVANTLTLEANTTVQGNGTAAFTLAGVVSGSGSLTKAGTSKLVLNADSSYAGPTVISAGTLQLGTDSAAGSVGSGAITNNATLRVERSGTFTLANAISGTGSLYVDSPKDTSTLVLAGANSFTGGVTINSGAVRLTNSAALGSGTKTVTMSNGTNGGPNLRLDGTEGNLTLPASISYVSSNASGSFFNEAGSNSILGPITLAGGGGNTKVVVSAGTLTLAGAIAPNTTGRFLDLAGVGTGIVTGAIANGSVTNTLGLNKNDTGTWSLNGPVSITANTSVNAGLLNVNSSFGAGGTVTVASAARLGGTGSIAATTAVNGSLQPGLGIGTITFSGNLSFGSVSKYLWELGANSAATAGTDFDRVSASAVTITAGAKLDLGLTASGVSFTDPFWASARSWTVLTCASRTGTFALGTVSADSAGRPASNFGSFSLQHTATTVDVVWTPLAPQLQWRSTWFATTSSTGSAADTADPDADGLSNLVEYALGSSPVSPTASPTSSVNGGAVALAFPRNPAATELTLTVEAADSLDGPWTPIARSTGGSAFTSLVPGVAVTDNSGSVSITDSVPVDNSRPLRVLRLQVVSP